MNKECTKLFQDKEGFHYGTSLPTLNHNADPQHHDSKKIIFCIHGKLSGCCTVVEKKIAEDNIRVDYHQNPLLYDHCHRERNENIDQKARKKLVIASILCLIFMTIEVVGGIWSNSLAIATDAAHLLSDFASFMISLFSIWVASRPATKQMPFGWYRAEVIGALTSVILIWVVTGVLVFLAAERLVNRDFDLNASAMLISSAFGVVVNLIMGLTLHQHGHSHSHDQKHNHIPDHGDDVFSSTGDENEKSQSNHAEAEQDTTLSENNSHNKNINVRAAYIHVIGDFIQSAGVFLAAIAIYFDHSLSIVDPICTFLFSILVILTTVAIIKDVVNILMEGIPKGFDYSQVENVFMKINGVVKVHNLRIWALSLDKTALSAHLAIKPGVSPQTILCTATRNIHEKYNFFEMTLQIEEFIEQMKECEQCKTPS